MIDDNVLKQKPPLFKKLTGLSVSEFDELCEEVAPIWAENEQKRLRRPSRRRTIGGGRIYAFDLQKRLLMTLMWLHLSLNTEATGYFFGVDKSTASRNTRRMLATLTQLGRPASAWPRPPKRGQGKNVEQAFSAYPDLQTFLEAMTSTDPLADNPEPHPILSDAQPGGQAEQPLDSVQLMAQTPPFQGLTPTDLDAVRRVAHQYDIKRHAFFFHQSDPATNFYILQEGRVRLTEVTPEGQQLLVRFVSPGESIGIIAALENSVYPLAAQAVEDCLALAWSSATLEGLMERYPRIAINGLRLVSQRWHELEERYRELATERVERRVAQALLRLVRQVGQKVEGGILIDLPLTRQDLAEMTGTTLYTVSRTFSRWEQKNLVETVQGRVLIRYPHGLTRIAEDLPPETPPVTS